MDKQYIKVATPITGEEEADAIRKVVLSGNLVSGKNVRKFEEQFSEYIGVNDSAAVNSGTAALHVALSVLGIGPGDEVIVPPVTFMSTITAVFHQNAIPIFADIDKDSFCISPEDIERKITSRTKAIIAVHLYGNSSDMDAIMEISRKYNLLVIEDCAQAIGTEYKGKKVGSIGHMGAFSFFATKHMTTGEGGIVTSNNKEWIKQSCIVRSHGLINRDDHHFLGYNYRMNEIAAAMGLVQLKKLENFNEQRINNSLFLLDELKQHSSSWYIIPQLDHKIRHTFFWCPLIINRKKGFKTKDIVKKLKLKGIEVRQRYSEPLYKQKVIQNYSPFPGGCPFTCQNKANLQDYHSLKMINAEEFAGNIIGIPNHPKLQKNDLRYIIDKILEIE